MASPENSSLGECANEIREEPPWVIRIVIPLHNKMVNFTEILRLRAQILKQNLETWDLPDDI